MTKSKKRAARSRPRSRSRGRSGQSHHDQLCSLVRFSLDEILARSESDLREHDAWVASHRAAMRKSGVRASQKLLPRVHRLACEAAERLFLETAPEVYVIASPELNASAITDSRGSALCSLHHGVVKLLEDDELIAVIAHEFGHAGLRHFGSHVDSPESYVYGMHRSCAGEVSADRIAVAAVGEPGPLTKALIKMNCGLDATELQVDIDEVLEQFAHPENQKEEDGLDTHPELPFRHWAMARFCETDVFAALQGKQGGESFDAVEMEIEDRFHSLDDGEAFVTTSDLLHQAAAWTGTMMVAHDEEITPREFQALSDMVGRLWAEDACSYARRNGLEAVERRARQALSCLRHAGLRARRRVLGIIEEIGKRSRNHARVRKTLRFVEGLLEG
jgi:Peptidase family M48